MFARDTLHLWILVIGLLLVGVGYAVVRGAMVPDSFGKNGHYRAEALQEERDMPRRLVSASECLDCHTETAKVYSESGHKEVHCSKCHDKLLAHFDACTKAFAEAKAAGTDTSQVKCLTEGIKRLAIKPACVRCHKEMVGRPKDFKVINVNAHLEEMEADEPDSLKVCLQCHLGHNPAEEPDSGDEEEEEEEADAAEAATPAAAASAADDKDDDDKDDDDKDDEGEE